MKVKISNMVWLPKANLDETALFLLKKNLTIYPKESAQFRKKSDDFEKVKKIEMYRELDDVLGIPRHYFRLNHRRMDMEYDYDFAKGLDLRPNEREFKLRDDQYPIMQDVYESLTCGDYGMGLLEAYTGFGKTVCAIDLICKLGGNALIIVPTGPLMEQWYEKIKEFYPNARIGMVRADKCIFENKDIVLATVQTLMKDSKEEQFPRELWTYFRTLVVDEVHLMGGKEFSKAIPRFNFRYGLGLSGTIRRADGCENVFKWYLGDIIAKAKDKNRIRPFVWIRDTRYEAKVKERVYTNQRSGEKYLKSYDETKLLKPTLLNIVAKDKPRTTMIAYDIVQALKTGRNPLVMSERKKLLYEIAKAVDEILEKGQKAYFEKPVTHGFFVGQTSEDQKSAASKCSIVYATIQLAKIGIDIVRLDTLFMATPLADVEQMAGRIARPLIKKDSEGRPQILKKPHQAMIVDYVDYQLDNLYSSHQSRLRQYARLNWKILNPPK